MRCERCGKEFDENLDRCPYCNASTMFSGNTVFYKKVKIKKIGMKDIFSGTFKKHPQGTSAKVFAAGSPSTTPKPDRMLSEWQKPWLYFRFLVSGIVFIALSLLLTMFLNDGIVMVLWSFGSLVIPWAVLMFIWEMNIPRDVSFVNVIIIFFAGGIFSLLLTAIISLVAGNYDPPFAAFVEEPAKLLVVAFFIHKMKIKNGFGGLLIGCAVGVGFAVFENMAYIFNVFYQMGAGSGFETFIQRGFNSFGGHTLWAAIEGCAIALGRKGSGKGFRYLRTPLFYIALLFSVGTHFTWNAFALSWVIVIINVLEFAFTFFLIKKCLAQVLAIYEKAVMSGAGAMADVVDSQSPSVEQKAVAENFGEAAVNSVPVMNLPAVNGYEVFSESLNTSKKYKIDEICTIGRDSGYCNMAFPADTVGVSRKHCAVCVSDDGTVYVMDWGSSVGTFLPDGFRVPANEWTVMDGCFYVARPENRFTVKMV